MKKAFTLIELLVVLAIIAVLSAILFPVLAQAKEAAKKGTAQANEERYKEQCIGQVKMLGTAVFIYISDYDDVLPPSASAAVEPAGVKTAYLFDVLFPYTKSRDLFLCPQDAYPGQGLRARLAPLKWDSDLVEFTSYTPNVGLFGKNLCGLPNKTTYAPVMTAPSLPAPADTIMLFDGFMRLEKSPLDPPNLLAQARHEQGVVICFEDGHAKYVKWDAIEKIAASYTTPAGSRSSRYYGWRAADAADRAACKTDPCTTDKELQAVSTSASNPYNDLHGVPGSKITDAEETAKCP